MRIEAEYNETIHPNETIVEFMLRSPKSIDNNLYFFPAMSEKAKQLVKSFDFSDDDDPRYMLPVIEAEKLFSPFSWFFHDKKSATSILSTLRLAYLLGMMDGKREERAKRKHQSE